MTTTVSVSELQLYRVLKRANLLQYYNTFIAQGGDDVQQLCEVDEGEFLEIMALVGMASKPLHVRRLQKALQEWVICPAGFEQPLVIASAAAGTAAPIPSATVAPMPSYSHNYTSHDLTSEIGIMVTASTWSLQSCGRGNKCSRQSLSPVGSCASSIENSQEGESRQRSPNPTPVLHDNQIKAIAEAAERLASTLPYYEPKPLNLKKQLLKEIEYVMTLPPENPHRMDEIRKYAAIYRRFDSKRKNEKPLSLHEISVNEAAAQLCKHIPTLLTRRKDLYPLARLVVRESGYQYSKGHSRSQNRITTDVNPAKKVKLDAVLQRTHEANSRNGKTEERLMELNQEFSHIAAQQESLKSHIQDAKVGDQYGTVYMLQSELEALAAQQLKLLQEQSDIIRRQKSTQKFPELKQGSGLNDESTDSSMVSGGSSPQTCQDETAPLDTSKSDFYQTPSKKNAHRRKPYINASLYEKGLRITQECGMSDFAEELKGMKPDMCESNLNSGNNGSEDDNKKSDEQREWEGEVEKDSRLDLSETNKTTATIGCNLDGQDGDLPVAVEISTEQDKIGVH